MFSESTEKSRDGIILEEYNIDNIDSETLESYRKRFKLHKGDNHKWNSLSGVCQVQCVNFFNFFIKVA